LNQEWRSVWSVRKSEGRPAALARQRGESQAEIRIIDKNLLFARPLVLGAARVKAPPVFSFLAMLRAANPSASGPWASPTHGFFGPPGLAVTTEFHCCAKV